MFGKKTKLQFLLIFFFFLLVISTMQFLEISLNILDPINPVEPVSNNLSIKKLIN